MKTRQPYVFDSPFAFGPGGRGRCRLRVFRPGPDRPATVIVTELPGAGPSITNAAEDLAADVTRLHSIDPDALLWVEHLLASPVGPEQFSAVAFERDADGELCRPAWRPITRKAVEFVIGGRLHD
jgi:hypothetical protein